MTMYNVHIYREMRLVFEKIEADTPEAAAAIAHDKPTDDADDIEDCNGDDSAALVDVIGDEDYRRSATIDFEPERIRKAAPKLLAALNAVMPYAEAERASLCEAWRHDRDRAVNLELHACDLALDDAAAAIALAKGAGILPATDSRIPRFEFTYEPDESPDRAYVLVEGKFDVAIIRTGEGMVVDVYPRHGIDPIVSTYAFDADAEPDAEAPEEA